MGYPEVDRRRSIIESNRQFGEYGVAQVDPAARENESHIAGRLPGRWLFRKRPELARLLRGQIWPQADEISTLQNSHRSLYTLAQLNPVPSVRDRLSQVADSTLPERTTKVGFPGQRVGGFPVLTAN